MIRPTSRRGALVLAIAVFAALSGVILTIAVLVTDGGYVGMFLPLFGPAGLVSWNLYRSAVEGARSAL